MQRGLVLLKNHLEMFRRRYAFHLRTWYLDGKGVSSHQAHVVDKASTPVRILLQTTGMTEKVIFLLDLICIMSEILYLVLVD